MNFTNTPQAGLTPGIWTRLTAAGGEILAPVTAPPNTIERRLLVARQATALLGVFGTVIQIVVWLMIAVIGGDLDVPWWLWTPVATGLLVGGLTAAHRLLPTQQP